MNTNQIAHVAALVGEPARTGMLLALMDGRALTARELAQAGHVSAATASRHLGLLVQAGLLAQARQGRHRYHRLASAEVARLLEGIMQLSSRAAAAAPHAPATGPRDAGLRLARSCYDHIAGRLGVAISDHLLATGAMVFEGESGRLTPAAAAVLRPLGMEVPAQVLPAAASPASGRRPGCRPCLDWSERRPHVAGQLGALLCNHCLERGWLLRRAGSRALGVTPAGAVALRDWLGHVRWAQVAA